MGTVTKCFFAFRNYGTKSMPKFRNGILRGSFCYINDSDIKFHLILFSYLTVFQIVRQLVFSSQ